MRRTTGLVRTGVAAGLLVAVACGAPRAASAQQRRTEATAEARELAADAKDAFDAGEWQKSLDLYRRAITLVPASTLRLREARCLTKLGRLVEAREVYIAVIQERLDASAPAPFREAVRDAKTEIETLDREIPRLKITTSGRPARLLLDGALIPPALLDVARPVDPGIHVITGAVAETDIAPTELEIARGERREVLVGPPARGAEGAPSAARALPGTAAVGETLPRSWAWVATGIAAGGLIVGAGAGLIATNKRDDLDDACANRVCPPGSEGDIDAFRSWRTASTVGYVVGITSAAAAVMLFLVTKPDGSRVARTGVSFDGSLSGQF